ncbi:uncharacterized protein LTR77_008141 [Saxophila tyrrhenica]|uniref:TAFII28-like protein domain-containing protein n=1 Tax=Saxophila tyrrhenica TaxID=1690608 RepID=A0AAV9P4Y3_9PEZI|nr:hypothetical protein LTR77_008141 [Saxophila tyrrhenica]
MASPPGSAATSPPGPSPLALPRQRPTLALPSGGVKSRKPSIASATFSAHPLRQTSFPPDSLEAQHALAQTRFSPSQASEQQSLDDLSESELASAISGPTGDGASARKRKRGEKGAKGRPKKVSGAGRTGSVSLVNGDEGATPRRGAPSVANAGDEEDEDDEEDEAGGVGGRAPLYEGGQMTAAEYETDSKAKAMFRQYVDRVDSQPLSAPGREGLTRRDMSDRYDVYNRAKLKPSDVRRLVNQTLSQSVPANVVTVVNSYTKMFAGILIEEAREVQAEWMAVERERADGEGNVAFKRLKRAHGGGEIAEHDDEVEEVRPKSSGSGASMRNMKMEETSTPTDAGTQPNGPPAAKDDAAAEGLSPGGAAGLSRSIEECDRGPLQPDHLREALRRYKASHKGGTVGFTGLSLEGREMAAPRTGGRRLFK